jgi:hypothetical protein
MSKELSRSAVGQIVAQVDADRSPLAGRCGRQPGQRRGFELDDLGLVYLEHHGARRPRQPVAAGVESGRQDHRLTQPRRRGVEKEIVEEPRAHRNLFPHLLLGEGRIVPSDSPSGSRVKNSWPTARTSGPANRSSINACGPRDASARLAATNVAVTPRLEAKSQLSRSFRAEPSDDEIASLPFPSSRGEWTDRPRFTRVVVRLYKGIPYTANSISSRWCGGYTGRGDGWRSSWSGLIRSEVGWWRRCRVRVCRRDSGRWRRSALLE